MRNLLRSYFLPFSCTERISDGSPVMSDEAIVFGLLVSPIAFPIFLLTYWLRD